MVTVLCLHIHIQSNIERLQCNHDASTHIIEYGHKPQPPILETSLYMISPYRDPPPDIRGGEKGLF